MSSGIMSETSILLSGITEDQRQFYYKLDGPSSLIAAFILLFALVWGSFMKVFIYSYYRTIKVREKLVNLYIMFDVITHHVVSFIYISSYVVFLIAKKPLAYFLNDILNMNIYDINVCFHFWGIGWFKFSQSSTFGLGMALFRVLRIRKATWVKTKVGDSQLMLLIILATAFSTGLMLAIAYSGDSTGKSVYNVCLGHSQAFMEVLHQYSGKSTQPVNFGMKIDLMITMVLQLAEGLCYALCFDYLNKHDKSMMSRSVISVGTFHKRKQQNVFTMAGQMYTFIFKLAFSMVMYTASNIGNNYSFTNTMDWMNLIRFTEFAVITTVQVLTSNEVRDHFFSFWKR